MRQSMDVEVSNAVRSKRLVLFGEMLQFYNYPDKEVLEELTGMLPLKFTPSLLTEQDLAAQAALRRPLVERDCRSSGEAEVDTKVWKQTIAECERGWLHGPLKAEEVPVGASISKRFGLRQRHKIRLIDDFTESSVNQSSSVLESPTLHTVGIACAVLACWFRNCKALGCSSELQVRTFDLASAYRQVGLCAGGRAVGFIRVYNPTTGQWAYFQAKVLPFGAVRSVHSFLRLARAIWWIGSVACLLTWSSFFDDYIVFSTPSLARSSDLTAAALFSLLGWEYATEGRKSVPFCAKCEALGVIFDRGSTSEGLCPVANTESRITDLVAELERVILDRSISQSDAQRLRGRMQFAESQLYGRTGKRCTRALREAASRRRHRFAEHELFALKLSSKLLQHGKPRTVCWDERRPIVIYTDACCEKDSKRLGVRPGCSICG